MDNACKASNFIVYKIRGGVAGELFNLIAY